MALPCNYCGKEIDGIRGHQCVCPECGSTRKGERRWLRSRQTGRDFWVCSAACKKVMIDEGHAEQMEVRI